MSLDRSIKYVPGSVESSQRAYENKQSVTDATAKRRDRQDSLFVDESQQFQQIAKDVHPTSIDHYQAKRLRQLPLPSDHTIADSTAQCIVTFYQLLERPQTRETDLASEVRPDLWQDLLGRLKIWTANFSADQHYQTSLDFHLRDATHLKIEIIALLEELHQLLTEAIMYLDEYEGLRAKIDPELSDSDESTSDDTTMYQGFYNSALVQIDCLFEMSLSISSHAKLDRIIGLDLADVSQYLVQDLQYIQQKFPYASPSIQHKLGRATAMRRAALDRYQQCSSHAWSTLPGSSEAATEKKGERSATNTTGSHDSSTSIPDSIRRLINPNRKLHIPMPLNLGSGHPYSCPYCHYWIDIHDKTAFAQHVLEDITPYQCLYETCTKSLQLFADVNVWLGHLRSEHATEIEPDRWKNCRLCSKGHSVFEPLEYHLAQHLEDLAIYVLPSLDRDRGASIPSDVQVKGSRLQSRRFPLIPKVEAQRKGIVPLLRTSEHASRKPSEYSLWIDGLPKSSSQAEQSREADGSEIQVMENFNKHVEDCESCRKALSELTTLCSRGTWYAKTLDNLFYHKAGKPYSEFDRDYRLQATRVLVPQAFWHVSALFEALGKGHFQGLIDPLEDSMTQTIKSDIFERERRTDSFSELCRDLDAGRPKDSKRAYPRNTAGNHAIGEGIHHVTVTPQSQGNSFKQYFHDISVTRGYEDNDI